MYSFHPKMKLFGPILSIIALFLIGVFACGSGVENILITNDVYPFACDPAEIMFWNHYRSGVLMYDGLTYPAADGGVQPHLAESWESVAGTGDDWIFHLRQGVKFHDGSDVMAEDVVFSFQRTIDLGLGAYGLVESIKEVSVVDDYTVRFTLKRPMSVFPSVITYAFVLNKDLVMQHLGPGDYGEMGDYGLEWLRYNDAGSGPYTLTVHEVNMKLEFERFEDYFLGWPNYGDNLVPIEKIRIIALWEPTTAKNLAIDRELDVTYSTFPQSTFDELDAIEGMDLNAVNKCHVLVFHLNTQKAPTDDVHFRRALNYAFDASQTFPVWDSRPGHVIGSIHPEYNPDLEIYEKNLDKMKEELALSKYPQNTPLTIWWPIGDYFFDVMVGALAADLSAAGFNIKVEQLQGLAPLISGCSSPDTQGHVVPLQYAPEYPDADSVLNRVWYFAGGYSGSHWFDDPQLIEQIELGHATVDAEQRKAIYQETERYLLEQAPLILVSEVDPVRAMQDYIYVDTENIAGITGAAVNFYYYRIDLDRKAELLGK